MKSAEFAVSVQLQMRIRMPGSRGGTEQETRPESPSHVVWVVFVVAGSVLLSGLSLLIEKLAGWFAFSG